MPSDHSPPLIDPEGKPVVGVSSSSSRLFHLDMVRGVAALLVCLRHLRTFQFVSPREIHQRLGIGDICFFFITSLGHPAVLVFFVLSGFFVAGSVKRDLAKGRWSWLRYATQRLTRLYVVLVPALLLTWICDLVVRSVIPGTDVGTNANHVLIGNLLYLQTLVVPVFGSNVPLWSLSYEFWYYLLFPLGLLAFSLKGRKFYRLACGILFVAIGSSLPKEVLLGGAIWLMGFGAFLAMESRFSAPLACHRATCAAAFSVLIAVILSFKQYIRVGPGCDYLDLVIGLSFALALPGLAAHQPKALVYRVVAIALSDISYTLYLIHVPLILLFWTLFLHQTKLVPSFFGYTCFAAVAALVLCCAAIMWRLFESRTNQVRVFVGRVTGQGARKYSKASGT